MSADTDGRSTILLHTPLMSVSWTTADRHRWVTPLALAGLTIGALLAVTGPPPLEVHGPWHQFGIMVPTCGATRAVRLTLLGDLAGAWTYNPLSPILVAGAVATLGRHLLGVCTDRWLTFHLIRTRVTVLLVAGVVLLLGVNQQLHAELLLTP